MAVPPEFVPFWQARAIQGLSQAMFFAQFNLVDGIVSAAGSGNATTARQFIALADALAKGGGVQERRELFDRMGRRAASAVRRSYGQTVVRRGGASGYRPDTRFSGGVLRAALQSPDMYEATADGLRFINVTLLDSHARQWARLNFGALPAGQGSRRTFQVTYSNVVIAELGLNEGPRPAFGIPPGYWRETTRGPAFYPTRRRPFSPTRGIRARNFLDAGLARIARDLGPGIDSLTEKLFDQGALAASRVRPLSPPGAPRRVRTFRSY